MLLNFGSLTPHTVQTGKTLNTSEHYEQLLSISIFQSPFQ